MSITKWMYPLFRRRPVNERRLLEAIASRPSRLGARIVVKYSMSSLFLMDCWRRLTYGKTEQLVAVAGTKIGDSWVPSVTLLVDYDVVTATEVRANPISSHRGLVRIGNFSHSLVSFFHSHPGIGPGAVHESGIDLATQRRLEAGGYHAIGGIYSRCGHLNFFSAEMPFEITILGGGIDRISSNDTHSLFRIKPKLRRVPLRSDRHA